MPAERLKKGQPTDRGTKNAVNEFSSHVAHVVVADPDGGFSVVVDRGVANNLDPFSRTVRPVVAKNK
ncbi:MAG: hypothetical protein Q7R31_00305 [Candidatus Levybacteria bacterium]|nr:hypothetical protein [Candidatus Levybacteria bacterium]